MSTGELLGDDLEQQDPDEARVQQLITKTLERYERRRRRLIQE